MQINKYYKLKEPELRLNTDFMVDFYEKHNTSQLLEFWWKKDMNLINKTTRWYSTINLR